LSNKRQVHIRSNVESYDDPYISDESLQENTICKRCGAIYIADRWYLKDQLPADKIPKGKAHESLCPACRKQRDRVPGGVLRLTGNFLSTHKDELMNLIRNESNKAQEVNPLERIMDMQFVGSDLEITTTNEKLTQRIGKAIHKAYDGTIEYKFSEDNKLARVNWHREV